MRLTGKVNLLKEHERRRLSVFATISWKSATQETLRLLWDAAQNKIQIARLYDLK